MVSVCILIGATVNVMKLTFALLALCAASTVCLAYPPCNNSEGPNGKPGEPQPRGQCDPAPVPPSLLLGAIGLAGCGILMAYRRKAQA
jgi:hypothetical protein